MQDFFTRGSVVATAGEPCVNEAVQKTNTHQTASQQPGALTRLYKTTTYVGVVVDVDLISESNSIPAWHV